MPRIWTRNFVKVCISSLFLFMTLYILITTLPIFIKDSLHGGQQEIGLMMTIFTLGAVLTRPFAGMWADGPHRKTLMLLSLLLFLLFTITYEFISTFPLLLALRFLHGVMFSLASTVLGAIAVDLVPQERKGEGIGYYGMFISMAMVVGPFVGLMVVNKASFGVLLVICTAFAVISAASGALVAAPASAKKHVHTGEAKPTFNLSDYIELNGMPFYITTLFLAIVYGSILTFLSTYAIEIGFAEISSFFFVVYAVAILVTRPFTGRIFDRHGPNRIMYPGILLFAAGMLVLSLAYTPYIFLAAGVIIGLGYGSVNPSLQTLAVQSADGRHKGLATGTYLLCVDLGIGIGSYALGSVAAGFGYRPMYMISSVIVLLCGVLYFILQRGRKQTAAQFAANEKA